MSKKTQKGDHSKSQNNIDLENIYLGNDDRTTLMIKNIPNKYTSQMVIDDLDTKDLNDTYDFFYMPRDKQHESNQGYAFINLLDPAYILAYNDEYSGKSWTIGNSKKLVELKYAVYQGQNANYENFKNKKVYQQGKESERPILLKGRVKNVLKIEKILSTYRNKRDQYT